MQADTRWSVPSRPQLEAIFLASNGDERVVLPLTSMRGSAAELYVEECAQACLRTNRGVTDA